MSEASAGAPAGPSTDEATRGSQDDQVPKKRRNPWIWVSLVLVIIAAGLLIWALTTQSDLDNAQQEADQLQSQLDQGKEAGGAVLDQGKGAGGAVLDQGKEAYDDLSQQLGATSEDLDATEQELADAQKKAAAAEQDAAAAEREAAQAQSETDKAQAATDKAEAEADAAESKATIAADCAKAYVSALGALFEGDSVRAQAEVVKHSLEGISATCKAALEGA